MLIKELFQYGMLNIISVYSSNFKNILLNMIKIKRNYKYKIRNNIILIVR